MNTSESVKTIAAALAAAQAEMGKIVKDKTAKVQTSTGGGYSFDYADLASMLDVVKPALAKHSIALVQAASVHDGSVVLDSRLLHSSGEWIESSLALKPGDTSPQKVGSAITYARRYSLACLVGVASEDEDDDGNAAQGNTAQVTHRTPPVTAPVPGDRPSVKAPPPYVAALWKRCFDAHGKEKAKAKWDGAAFAVLGDPNADGYPPSHSWTAEQTKKVEDVLFPPSDIPF